MPVRSMVERRAAELLGLGIDGDEPGFFGEKGVSIDGPGDAEDVVAVDEGGDGAGAEIELLEMNALRIFPDVEIDIENVGGFAGQGPDVTVEGEPGGFFGDGISTGAGEGMGGADG